MSEQNHRLMMWLPSLYFAKGMPYVVIMVLSLLLFRQMGQRLSVITLLVACFYLPWVLKPLWKARLMPLLECRTWILLTEFLLMLGFACLAFVVDTVGIIFASLLTVAFLTAIHNVAVDELFRKNIDETTQYNYRHVKEFFRMLAVVVGQGVIVMMVGNLQILYRNDITFSWSFMFYVIAGFFILFVLWHLRVIPNLKRVEIKESTAHSALPLSVVSFLLFYGISPAFLSKVVVLYLVEPVRRGGLGLSPQEFGFVMGSLGIFALTVGGLIGSKLLTHFSFCRCKWPMALTMLVPSLVYVYMSSVQPVELWIVSLCISIDQLCYGIGFSAYLFLLHRLGGEFRKSLLALSMMIPCAVSGFVVSETGFPQFFIISFILGGVGLLSVWFLNVSEENLKLD